VLSERYDRLGNRSGDEGAYHEEKADHGNGILLESGDRCLVAIDARREKIPKQYRRRLADQLYFS
jgi:hypothetical protein